MDYIEGTIDRFEDGQAVIKTNEGQQIVWPKDKLTAEIKEGDAIQLYLVGAKTQTAANESIAKALLNQIIKDNKS